MEESYYQQLCEAGHYRQPDENDSHDCDSCGAPIVWNHFVKNEDVDFVYLEPKKNGTYKIPSLKL